MGLTAELSHQKNKAIKAVPKETLAIMNSATVDLDKSGIVSNCLKEGDKAPDFILKNISGETVQLQQILKTSGVILKFFRGDW